MRSSLPSRGAWVEIGSRYRGFGQTRSLPSRGAWVEMSREIFISVHTRSLPSRGAWVEIEDIVFYLACEMRRSPRGERGLKF